MKIIQRLKNLLRLAKRVRELEEENEHLTACVTEQARRVMELRQKMDAADKQYELDLDAADARCEALTKSYNDLLDRYNTLVQGLRQIAGKAYEG